MNQFNFSQAREQLRGQQEKDFGKWLEDPAAFEGKETISAEEVILVCDQITELFREELQSGVSLDKIKKVLMAIQSIENRIINEESRRPWNYFCLEHAGQTASIARFGARFFEPAALLHDIGRCFSHHPWIHGLAGEAILTSTGTYLHVYAPICYMHLEAGAPLLGFTPENWRTAINASNLKNELSRLSISSMVITLSDMAKKDGMIVDPIQGVYHSGLRRLSEEEKYSLGKIDPSKLSMEDILSIKVEKLAMYLALCWVFDQQLKEFGIVFSSYLSEGERYYKERYDF